MIDHLDDELLGLGEAARRVKVTPETLRRWADKGFVTVYKTPAGTRRFRATDIAELARQTGAAS